MRKIMLLCLASLMTTLMWSQAFVDENFSGGVLPAGWTNNDLNESGQVWEFDNPGNVSANLPISAPFAILDSDHYGSGGIQNAALETPAFDASSATSVFLDFDYYHRQCCGATIYVEVFNGASWIEVHSESSSSANPAHLTLDITTALAGATNAQVRFRYTGDWDYYWIIDNVRIAPPPSCLSPSDLVVASVASNTADISWTAGDTETDWNISWGTPGYTPGVEDEGTANQSTTPAYQITGLSVDTNYEFYVQANCGGDTSIWTGPMSFKTLCAAVTTPWSDDVEGQTGTGKNIAVNGCWTASPTTGFAWNVSDSNTVSGSTGPDAAHSGSKFFFTESSNGSTGSVAELYSPLIDVSSLTTPALSFYYHMYGATTGDLNVYVHDGTNWNPVVSLSGQQQTAGSDPWIESIVTLSGYTGNIQVKFEVTRGSSYTGDIAIDDISVIEAPSCPDPTSLTLDALTTTTADFSWTAGNIETAWNVSWGTPGYSPSIEDIGTDTAAETSYQITGLDANTQYEFYVQASCDVSDVSGWVGPIAFQTPCNPGAIPFFEGFESGQTDQMAITGCWTQESITGSQVWTANNSLTTYNRSPRTGNYSAYLRYSNSDWLFIPLTLEGGTAYEMKFYAKQDASSGTTIEAAWGTADNAAAMTNTIVATSQVTSGPYQEYSGFFTPPSNGVYYVGIKATLSGSPWFISLDDISVDIAPTCLNPSDLATTGITATTADISWTANGTETNWNISWGYPEYIPGSEDLGSNAVNATATYQITGLDANNEYEVYIQADCGEGETSSWVGPLSFTTACEPLAIPYLENFDTNGTGSDAFPDCWSRPVVNISGTTWPSIVGRFDTPSSPNALKFQSQTATATYAVSPAFAEDINNLRVSFMLKREGTSSGSIDVGVMSDASDISTFELVQTINPANDDWTEYIYDLDQVALSGTGNYIALRHNSNSSAWYYWVDDFAVTTMPLCSSPDLTLTVQNASGDPITCLNDGDEYYVLATLAGGSGNTSYNVSANGGTEVEITADASEVFGPFARGTDVSITATGVQDDDCSVTTAINSPVNCPPANENCAGAIALDCNATPETYSSGGSTAVAPSGCSIGANGIWFSFVGTGADITINSSATFDHKMSMQTGTCEALTWIACKDSSTGSETYTIADSVLNQMYYVYVAHWSSSSTTTGDITISIVCEAPGFVYEGGVWTPSDPSVDAGPTDDIFVVDGVTSFTSAMEVNNITVMSGATLNVEGTLTINGDITNDGNLVFVSSATANGELAAVPGTSTITGDVTVERYMKAKRSYRMVSSAVTTSTSVHDNWQEGAISNTDNPNAGFGTHITGSTADQMNGFDGTITGNPSMFTVNVAAQMFEAVTNTDVNTLVAGEPYLLFVRGDRSIDLTDDLAAGETVLRATGSLVTGTQTQNYATSNAGDVLMFGNPYQSAVDVNAVFAASTNLNTGYYYVYDSELGAHGSYVTVMLPGGTNTSGSVANQFLQPGQGAQAAALAAGATSVVFDEANKAPGNFTSTSRPVSANDMLTVQLFTTENFNNGGPVHDSFGIIFADGNDNGITPADAVKPMNFYENLGVNNNGTYLSIEQRALPQVAEVYSMYTTGYTKSDYTLKVVVDGLEANFLYLDDHFTGTSMLLEAGENSYSYRVDANDALSIATDRFSIRTEQRLGVDDNSLLAGIRLFPNPLNGDTFYINAPKLNGEQLSVSISDLSGRNIYEQALDCRANTVTVPMGDNIASGVYLVTLTNGGESQTYRLIKE